MFKNEKKSKLTELIDVDFLQEFQDTFAETMNVASMTYDTETSVTKPSRFTDFCSKYTRGSQEGAKRCQDCDLKWGKVAAETGKPVIYNCHAGLVDFAVPIMVENRHIGTIFGGQIFTEPPNETFYRKLAKDLDIDEDKYIEAMRKIRIVPKETVESAAHLLYIVANSISKISHKNFELLKNTKKETLYRHITEAIRSSLDINETKQKIIEIVGKALNADRCFIMDYDQANDEFLIIKDEYTSSDDIVKYEGADGNKDVPNFITEFKKGDYLVIENKEVFIGGELKKFEIEEESIKKFGVISAYGFPLFHNNELLGVLGLHYLNQEHEPNEEEIGLLKVLANQIAIALYQAKLYQTTQMQVSRESLLRNITEKIRISDDIDEILSYICEETAKLFNVQRIAITEFPNSKNYADYIIRKEYKYSPEISGLMEQKCVLEAPTYWGNSLMQNDMVLAFDNLEENDTPDCFKNTYIPMGIKSIMGTSIRKGGKVWGTLVLSEYNNYRHWSEEEKNLLKTIANQIYISINQAELNEQAKKQAKREKFSRNIVEILRNTLDKKMIKHLFVQNIAKYFDADRVFFADFDPKKNMYLPVDGFSEFLSSPEEKSFVGYDWASEAAKEYVQPLLEKREVLILCWGEYIEKNPKSAEFRALFEDANVKSSYNLPVLYEGKIIGYFCIEFTKDECEKLSNEDISVIRNICTQAGIALYHADIYEKERQVAQRESLLRKIIEIIRSSIEIDQTLAYICEETAKLFNVQRTAVSEIPDSQSPWNYIIRMEYKASGEQTGIEDLKYMPQIAEFYANYLLKEGKVLAIDNISESNMPDYFKEGYNLLDIKSVMSIPIQKGTDKWGILVLSDYKNYRTWSEEEIQLAESIASQLYIAIKQAELYDKEKKTAQREKLLSDIVTTIRSSLDIDEIKKNVVNEVGRVFKADRCYFRRFDKKKNKFLPPDYEYIASDELPSLADVVPDDEALQYFQDELNRRGKGFYPIVVDEEFAKGTPLERYLKAIGLKADYAMPILDRGDELIWLVLHYTQKDPKLDEDDKKLLETVASQIVIALNQAKAYKITQVQAEREKLIGNITIKALSTFDINQIKQLVSDIGVMTKADRCYFVEVDYERMKGKPIDFDGEWRSSPDIKSIIGYDFPTEDVRTFVELYLKKTDVIAFDYENIRMENEEKYAKVIRYSNLFDLKSGIGIPFIYMGKFTALLAIEYVRENVLPSDDELDFLRILGNQMGLAFNQIRLYQNTKQTAEREKILRELISGIKLTQNLDQAYNYVIAQVTEIFNVEGVIFIEVPDLAYKKPTVKYEYIKNNELPSFQTPELPDACSEMFSELEKSPDPIIVNDTKLLHANNEAVQEFCKTHLVKSFMAITLAKSKHGKKAMGIMFVCTSKSRIWAQKEIDLLRAVSESAAMMIWEIQKLNEISELINTFTLTLKNEFEIPLITQEKALEFLASQKKDLPIGGFKKFIVETLNSLKGLSGFLSKLLKSYEYESGKKELVLEESNIVDIVNMATDELKDLAESKSITVNINFEKNLPKVEIDKSEIKNVIHNLLKNAITYTQKGGTIEIKSFKIDKEVGVCISDNGPGIPSEISGRIFQRYAMAQVSEKKIGSGLGLYLSKLIIEAHKGKIWDETAPGIGTIVCFVLPTHQ